MKNARYNEREAARFVKRYRAVPADVARRIYTSQLLGGRADLVLHGGGNTSVKVQRKNIFGEIERVLYVKGSGVDLATIGPEGFAQLNLDALCRIRKLKRLDDAELVNQLQTTRVEHDRPDPSVEALLHAFLPFRFVDHTHADSILMLANQREAKALIGEVYGDDVALLPYTAPGLPLAQAVASAVDRNPALIAVIVRHHGIFTFGDDARASYSHMLRCVVRAERFIRRQPLSGRSVTMPQQRSRTGSVEPAVLLPLLRGACASRSPDGEASHLVVELRDSAEVVAASLDKGAKRLCESGVITPDHAIRTKDQMLWLGRLPADPELLSGYLRDRVDQYCKQYARYVARHGRAGELATFAADPYPRVVLVAGVGVVALGRSRRDAIIAADIAEHAIRVKRVASSMSGYARLGESHVFDMEFWPLQRRKITARASDVLAGQVALVTGGGGAIGLSIADGLARAGAAVVISDVDAAALDRAHRRLAEQHEGGCIAALHCDVTDEQAVAHGYAEICRRLGGVDIVVPNAGVAHVAKLSDLKADKLRDVSEVNFIGCFNTIKGAAPILRRQRTGGNVVIVSSKNVFAPGASFGAYSASKAAAHQLGKIAAMELADIGVRVNMVNPDGVFSHDGVSSKLWDLVGPERMKSRGLDPKGLREYYRQRNLLKAPIYAEHVAHAVLFFATNQSPTTGATLPIDGGVPAAFPR